MMARETGDLVGATEQAAEKYGKQIPCRPEGLLVMTTKESRRWPEGQLYRTRTDE